MGMQSTHLLIVERDVHYTKHSVNRKKVTFKGTFSFAPPQPGSSTSNLVVQERKHKPGSLSDSAKIRSG